MKSHEISIFSDTPRSIQVYPVLIHPHSYCHFGSSLQAPSDTAWQNVSWAVTTGGSENGHSQFFTLYVFHRENAFFFNMLKTTTTIGVHTLCSDKPIWSCNPCSSPHWVVSSDFLLETSRYQGGPATLSQECQGHPKIQSQMGFK